MSDVYDLTSSLNLVICDESSVNAEMRRFCVRNVGWASEITDDWNDVRPRHSAVESHSSTLQSADNSSRLLQSCLFCMSISISFLSFILCLRVDCMNVTQTSDFAMHHSSELILTHSCGSWLLRLESRSRESFFKVLGLVFWLFFGHRIGDNKWRQTFVGRSRHKALFTNLCCMLIVESLNGDQLYFYQ